MIPYSRQYIDEDDIKAVVDVLKSDWLTQGPNVLAFEKALAEYTGAKYAVAAPNGTAALYLAYRAAGLKEGDEIITTPNTFVATSNMAIACGARPVFCDIRLDTYNIDEEKIKSLITKKTRAIVPVHFAGHPCEMDKISEIAKQHNLLIIEDACHAIGSEYKGKRIGGVSDMSVFSFHPVKPITAGEGGAILTNNENFYKEMLKHRNHGIIKDPQKSDTVGKWFYEMVDLGFNNRVTDIQCALGLSQLKKLERFQKAREERADYYFEKLKNLNEIVLPAKAENIKHSWHLFVLRLKDSAKRRPLYDHLQANGIGVQIHYIPVHHQPYYRALGYKNESCPNSVLYYNSALSIPLYPSLAREDQDKVIKTLYDFYAKN